MASTIKATNIGTPDGTGNITLDRPLAGDVTINSGDLVFSTAAKGVCLGVTSNTDANTLDDYEEGTWTPILTVGSGSSHAYSEQVGYYTKIGRVVSFWGRLTLSSLGTASGNAGIGGLPFTTNASTNHPGYLIVTFMANGNITAGTSCSGIVNSNDTTVNLQNWDTTGRSTALQVSEVTASGVFGFGGSYIT